MTTRKIFYYIDLWIADDEYQCFEHETLQSTISALKRLLKDPNCGIDRWEVRRIQEDILTDLIGAEGLLKK